jgi:hypothetical protein
MRLDRAIRINEVDRAVARETPANSRPQPQFPPSPLEFIGELGMMDKPRRSGFSGGKNVGLA